MGWKTAGLASAHYWSAHCGPVAKEAASASRELTCWCRGMGLGLGWSSPRPWTGLVQAGENAMAPPSPRLHRRNLGEAKAHHQIIKVAIAKTPLILKTKQVSAEHLEVAELIATGRRKGEIGFAIHSSHGGQE